MYWLGIWSCYSCCCCAFSFHFQPATIEYRRRVHHMCLDDALVLSRHRQQQQSRIGYHCLRRELSSNTPSSLVRHAHQIRASSENYDDDNSSIDANSRSIITHNVVTNHDNHSPNMSRRNGNEINDNTSYAVQKQTRNISYSSRSEMKQTSTTCFDGTNLLHSIALVASCRRLSFLFLSVVVVNFVRSTILKVSVFYAHQLLGLVHEKIHNWPCISLCRYPKAIKRCLTNVHGHLHYFMIHWNLWRMERRMW